NGVVAKYESDEGIAAKKIQWVPVESAVACMVKIPKDLLDSEGKYSQNSLSMDEGVCEPSCKDLPQGTIVQFERYGYAKLDKKEDGRLVFIFSC
ncbi:MAG: hypothetical protein QW275_00675, partial [Candidatus Anstonellaceae archaeon]